MPTGESCLQQYRICTVANNVATLSGSYTKETCVQNCSGSWSACSAACGGGTQTYNHDVEANFWGAACATAAGATQACNVAPCGAPVNCVGSWGPCGAGSIQTYNVTTPASGGGSACPVANGATQACICYDYTPTPQVNCPLYNDYTIMDCGSGPEVTYRRFSAVDGVCWSPITWMGCAYSSCTQIFAPTCIVNVYGPVACPL